MPVINPEIPEVQESVTRPVNMQIVQQYMQTLGIDPKTPVRYIANGFAIHTTNSSLDPEYDPNPNRLQGDQKITVEIVEDWAENYAISEAVQRIEQRLVFADTKLRVFIKPVYKAVKSNITIAYRCRDRVAAEKWYRRVKIRASRMALYNLHNVNYHYPVPQPALLMLTEIYKLRDATASYGDTVGQWYRECFTPKSTVITNQIGNGLTRVINETQGGILGWAEFGHAPPRPDPDNPVGCWVVSFNYSFQYDQPVAVCMEYPMQIHNQILPDRFRYDFPAPQWYQYVQSPNLSGTLLNGYRWAARSGIPQLSVPGIPVPHFDDWLPLHVKPLFMQILRAQLQVDLDIPTAIVSLPYMGDWTFDPEIIAYLRELPISITQLYESVFNFELHRGSDLTDPNQLIVNNQLDIINMSDLDPRENYHMVLSVLTDPSKLTSAALARLVKFGFVVRAWLTFLWPGLADIYGPDFDWTTLTLDQLRGFIKLVMQHTPGSYSYDDAFWGLVYTATIIADRSE